MADFATGQFVDAPELNPVTADAGDFCWSGRRTKTGWLKCDAAAYSRTTYAVLFAAIVPTLGVFTVTIASPGVFTLAAHGLVIGDHVYLTTTGALPTGLSPNTIYYVLTTPTSGTFTLATVPGGSAINTSGSQSGAHTLYYCPFGLGDGSTTFNVPDAPGRSLVAAAGAGGADQTRAAGANDGVTLANRRGTLHRHSPHVHTVPLSNSAAFAAGANTAVVNAATTATSSVDGGSGVATDPLDGGAFLVANLFIKT